MSRRVITRLGTALVCAVGASLSWSAERSSVERANRLHRAGAYEAAAGLYRAGTERRAADPLLRYNLGTTLAEADDPAARAELARALSAASRDIRARAQYNTGLLHLEEALGAGAPDSVRTQAEAAVEANAATLRLLPDNDDAKWNLAMSLRLLDSIDAMERRSGRELTEGAMEADVVTRSVNVPDAAEDEFAEDPPAEGEQESVVLGTDESPLSLDEAEDILGRTHLDPTDLIGKLLALESRSRWGQRLRRGVLRW
jgi:hypothetical protein